MGFLGRLLRDQRGTATTETVIMIPVFVVLWGGIWYTHQRYDHSILMAERTRADAWEHVLGACESSASRGTTIGTHSSSAEGIVGAISFILTSVIPGFRFDEIEATNQTTVERPAVLGEGSVELDHNLVLLCNEPEYESIDSIEEAWGMFGI